MLKKILIAVARVCTLGLPLHTQVTQADAEKYATQAEQYYQQGKYAKALEYFNKALAICLKVLGENHPDTATCYNNIGLVYDSQGNYAQALEFYNKALAIRLKVLGENHADTAVYYGNIGGVYSKQGNYAKALEYFNKALAIAQKVLGPDHPDTKQISAALQFVENKLSK